MSRMNRLKVLGESAYYHIMSFTVSDEFYLKAIEKEKLKNIIQGYSRLYFVKVITYCIMSNHFHLLIKMETGESLSDKELILRLKDFYGDDKIINDEDLAYYRDKLSDISDYVKFIKQTFSRWYNKLHNRRGYFWGERFKSVLIQDGNGLLTCMAYIDLNPIRAKMVKLPEDYRWSGIGYRVQSGNRDGFLSFDGTNLSDLSQYREIVYILGGFDKDKKGKISQDIIEKQEKLGFKIRSKDLLLKRIRYFSDGLALGSKTFIKEVYSKFANKVIFKKDRKAYNIKSGIELFGIRNLQKDLNT